MSHDSFLCAIDDLKSGISKFALSQNLHLCEIDNLIIDRVIRNTSFFVKIIR